MLKLCCGRLEPITWNQTVAFKPSNLGSINPVILQPNAMTTSFSKMTWQGTAGVGCGTHHAHYPQTLTNATALPEDPGLNWRQHLGIWPLEVSSVLLFSKQSYEEPLHPRMYL